MTKAQLKDWADFYGRLTLVSAWNGLLRFVFVYFGGTLAQQSGLVDLPPIAWSTIGWTLLGTIVASIAGELYKHPLPTPTEPSTSSVGFNN